MSGFEFRFACEGVKAGADPWDALRVVRFHGQEAISSLYRYEIVLLAPVDQTSVAELIGKRCSLRIATLSAPAFKTVHGIVVEAEEIASLTEGRVLRAVVMPPCARAMHRRRCRIFLDKTLRQIIERVLEDDPLVRKAASAPPEPDLGDPDFTPAREAFAWRIDDASRLDNKRVRSYVVQYNESDLAFVSRLLEDEGIAYHVENGADTSLLVFCDSDAGRPRLDPAAVGAGISEREVKSFVTGARLRPESVALGDYNWKQPGVEMTTRAGDKGADLFEHVYPGGYPDEASQGRQLAGAILGRHRTEARFARGEGRLRVLSAGTIFQLEHTKARYEGEYLVTSLEVSGEQAGVLKSQQAASASEPFVARFECARRGDGASVKESHFRPARATPRPLIIGSQTAVVTAEPSASGAEINVGGPDGIDIGCVRLRFHWDTDKARLAKEPSSAWARVSEAFAGSGMGGVWHPRVGTEVIVEFEGGDPDRPIVVGRVYNGVNQPHGGGSPAVSTFKSNASPGGAVHNEITFVDTAGSELIYTNAGKDMETDVGNNRTETVASNAAMKVGANDTENIGANCAVLVGANDTLTVGANELNSIGANGSTMIAANSTTIIGGHEVHLIGSNQTITIGATHTEIVGASVIEDISGTLTTTVGAVEMESIGANRTTTIAGAHTQQFGAAHIKLVGGDRKLECGGLTTQVGAASIRIVGGSIKTKVGADHTLDTGGGAVFIAPMYKNQDKHGSKRDSTGLELIGLDVTLGGAQATASGVTMNIMGAILQATGTTAEFVGAEITAVGTMLGVEGAELHEDAAHIRIGLIINL